MTKIKEVSGAARLAIVDILVAVDMIVYINMFAKVDKSAPALLPAPYTVAEIWEVLEV